MPAQAPAPLVPASASPGTDAGAPRGGRRPGGPRAVGRRVAQVAYFGVAALIIVASTLQIIQQVFFLPTVPSPYGSCREGLLALVRAVERAREAAPGTDGEDAALARFRSELAPEWTYRDGVAATCRGSEEDKRALDAIERLRYAEEHAARREAGDLAPLRRRVRAIVDGQLGPVSPR
ncbi:hypothetical protein SOCEGT47_032910 [Sorangium cellulosum]|uniref:Uncharacterized protein n=1 Tax=Sorangium cellulosum TaxID=56 RepID=A0A4P2Q135_SORCE|nr:hypothetical protein [Sorangium cellulosum]AUX22781.1 hypothetical protein SOCEGT47_032910 [Sorangium cellulosum]